MALKCAPYVSCSNKTPRLNASSFQPQKCGMAMSLRYDIGKCMKWKCCCLHALAHKAVIPIEDDKRRHVSGADSSVSIAGVQENQSKGSLDLLSKSATDLSPSPDDGSKVQVAYQGQPGAYSEEAALKALPNCEPVPFDEFEDAFRAVELGEVDKAIIPIENSISGSIYRNYDLLLHHRLHIAGEIQLQVDHCLLGLPGVRKEELNYVISHPQALAQCEEMLDDLGVNKVGSADTAGAAQKVSSEGRRDTGAIASSRAAKIYGLDVLEERIQDIDDNVTRFFILAREPVIPGTDKLYKTSIVFSLKESPGFLLKVLAEFSQRNISVTNIETRPLNQSPIEVVDDSNEGSFKYFDYLFYIDFEASLAEPRAQYVLGQLQEYAPFLRVLGCYPIHTSMLLREQSIVPEYAPFLRVLGCYPIHTSISQ